MPPIDDLVKNPWFQVSGFAVGVVGILIAIATYCFSRRYKRLWYSSRSFTLVEHNRSTISALKVLFDDRPVAALTVTKVVLWNSGKEALRDQDFPAKERLCLRTAEDIEILEAAIIQTRSESCNCAIARVQQNCFELSFDFLDPRDGLVVQLAHTGNKSSDVSIEGRIVGEGRVEERSPMGALNLMPTIKIFPKSRRRARVAFALLLTAMAIFMMASPWLKSQKPETPKNGTLSKALPVFFGGTYLLMAYSVWRSRPPRGLERFDDEFQ